MEGFMKKLNPGQPIPAGCRFVPGPIPNNWAKISLYDPTKLSQLESLRAGFKKILRKEEINNYCIENEKRLAYGEWRASSDKRVLSNNVKRDVESLLAQRDDYLDERRERMKQLFQEEEENYLIELELKGETPDQQYIRMSNRLANLQAQKEAERLKLVKEKLEQRWREACPGLREIISKQICKEVTYERDEQLLHQKCIKEQVRRQEQIFTECYLKDVEMQFEKGRLEDENVKKRAYECARIVVEQCQEKEAQLKELENLKKAEAALMEQQRILMELDIQWEISNKHNMHHKTKRDLDKCIVIKNKLQMEQKQQEYLIDQFYLSLSKTLDLEFRKRYGEEQRELHHQQKEFMKFLRNLREEERLRGLELERLSKIENDRMWNERQKLWDMEKEARVKLTRETYEGIFEQIQCNLKLVEERRKEIIQEGLEVDRKVAEYRLEAAEKLRLWKEEQQANQDAILAQMEDEKRLQREEFAETLRSREKSQKEEEEYLRVMKMVTADPTAALQMHPCRRNKFHIKLPK